MTGAVNSNTKKKLSIEFSDANKVTYCEKMLMRKYQDGSMAEREPPRSNGLTEHSDPSEATKEEEDAEPLPAISQYNVFYDIDVMPAEEMPAGDEGVKCETVLSSEDFGDCKPPPRVSIEEVSFKNLGSTVEEPSQEASKQPGAELKQEDSKQPSAREAQKDKQPNASGSIQKPAVRSKSAKKKKKITGGHTSSRVQATNPPVPSGEVHSEECSAQQHKLPDLTESVKAAWKTCSQSDQTPQPLTHFFLHGVSPMEDENEGEENVPPLLGDDNNASAPNGASGGGDDTSNFKLGPTIWLPHSSTVQTAAQSDKGPSHHHDGATSDAVVPPPPPPPSSRPSTSQCGDRYYDDTESDSEPENEREEFISSRLGMTRDSVEWSARPTPSATPCPDLEGEEEEEEEEKVERDRADCEALEDLAWELASTVDCEGRLTRNEGDLEESDLKGGTECDREGAAATPMGAERCGEDWTSIGGGGDGGEVMEMSKVMSNFELYQRDLMEADSD